MDPPLLFPPGRVLRIWSNFKLPNDLADDLRRRLGGHELVLAGRSSASNLVPGAHDPDCRAADVAFGQPAVEDLLASTSLRWIHLTSAGYTRYDRDDLRQNLMARGAVLTNSSRVYANPCAQHVLSMMLAHNRRLSDALINQVEHRRWEYQRLRPRVAVLDGQSVLIVGFGAIGRRLVELLQAFAVQIAAVRRRVAGDEPVRTFAHDRIDELLGESDHVVNVLPSAPGNERFFSADRFTRMKHGAAFYNVGRGDTVDQDALIAALRSGQLSAAYLDVTTPEPLPADHPLWTTPNCRITPHVAGGTQDEMRKLVDHFVENLQRIERGEPLVDRVV